MREGIYPVVLDGKVCGSLEVRSEGCFEVFSVKTRPVEGVTRISAYGGGREGYLGVLMPENGCMTLKRALSRLALRSFPEEIACAGAAGLGENGPEVQPDAQRQPDGGFPEGDIDWRRTPEGVLVGFALGRSLVAFPEGDGRAAAAGEGVLREIDGKSYLVYAVENGLVRPLRQSPPEKAPA